MTDRNSTIQSRPKQVKKYVRNTEQFIVKATDLHDGVYSYERSVYVTATDKMVITCKEHGDFLLSSSKHLKGVGCHLCSVEERAAKRRKTKGQYIKEANKVHLEFYRYDKIAYKNTKTKICITCPLHGDFWQEAGSHLAGCKCPDCYYESRFLTQEEFIKRSIERHGKGFDYSEAVYVSSGDRVKLTCNTCMDTFYQLADGHMRGLGCRNCAGTRPVTQDEFIAQAKERYGNRFDYSQVDLINKSEPVKIVCGLHGLFEQRPYSHLVGGGCPKCSQALRGYNRSNFVDQCNKNNDGKGTLYVIQCKKDNEFFYKIGITSKSVKRRFYNSRLMPYDYESVYLVVDEPEYIYDLENKLHSLLTEHNYEPLLAFSGQTECFTTIKPIEKLLKQLSSTDQLQLIA